MNRFTFRRKPQSDTEVVLSRFTYYQFRERSAANSADAFIDAIDARNAAAWSPLPSAKTRDSVARAWATIAATNAAVAATVRPAA
jgi:hypothetical protein